MFHTPSNKFLFSPPPILHTGLTHLTPNHTPFTPLSHLSQHLPPAFPHSQLSVAKTTFEELHQCLAIICWSSPLHMVPKPNRAGTHAVIITISATLGYLISIPYLSYMIFPQIFTEQNFFQAGFWKGLLSGINELRQHSENGDNHPI
jgi:hypothetical protein